MGDFNNDGVYSADSIGRKIETLVDKTHEPETDTVTFDTEGLPAGVYFYRLIAGKKVVSGKMMVR